MPGPRKERFGSKTKSRITEKSDLWHRLSYSAELWSTGENLEVDFEVNVVSAKGEIVDRKTHRRIILQANGQHVQVSDFILVRCPSCNQIAGLQTLVRIR